MPNRDAVEAAALAKLKQLLDDQDIQIFTKEEVETIRDMISAWRGLAALGFLGGLVRPAAWIVGAVIAIWLASKGKFDALTHVLWG